MLFSHFAAALFLALVISVVFGVTSRNTDRERLLYSLWVFGLFLVITIGGAWLMHLLHL